MKVFFRTDASLEIGSGHVMRCLTLADALQQLGCECLFVCREHKGHLNDLIRQRGYEVYPLPVDKGPRKTAPIASGELFHLAWLGTDWATDAKQTSGLFQALDIDLLIVDHYALDVRWENALRPHCNKVMVIDDLADRDHDCDFLLDQNLVSDLNSRYKTRVSASCGLMLGPIFALLQPQYGELHDRVPLRDGAIRRILIYFGGADIDNLTGMALSAFLTLPYPDIQVDVVMNPKSSHANTLREQVQGDARIVLHETLPSLARLMADADLAIGAAGATSWERCSLGLPSLVITLAENQKPIAAELRRQGFIRWLGHKNEIVENDVAQALKQLIESGIDTRWSERCAQLVDGLGARRVSEILTMSSNSNSNMIARPATRYDESQSIEKISVQQMARSDFEAGRTPDADYSDWFRQALRDVEGARIYMVETQEGVPLGWVHFSLEGEFWRVFSNFGTIADKLRLSVSGLGLSFCKLRSSINGPLRFSLAGGVKSSAVPSASKDNYAGSEGLSIAVCSDQGGWINDAVSELLISWLYLGHDVTWVNCAEDAPGGDLCFYLSYGRIVDRDVRSRYTHNLVVHESDLPLGRGWSPMSWQILEGASRVPVTLLEADDDVDAGAIYLQEWIDLEGWELSPEWRALQAQFTIGLCQRFVEGYPAILAQGRTQVGQPTRYLRRRADDSRLDPTKSISEQFSLLRIVNNEDYPAFFELAGKRFVLRIEAD